MTFACLSTHATTRLEKDIYLAPGPDPYANNVPWVVARTEVFTTSDGSFRLYNPYSGNPDYVNSVHVSFLSSTGGRWIDLDFSTDRMGVPLAVGVYLGAQRFPFNGQGRPGLDLTDTGSGFNTLDGQFRVFDITRNSQGAVTSFAASFEIFNYPAPSGSPLVGGRIWYNSDATMTAVPEPATWVLAMAGMGIVAAIRRRSTASPDLT